MHWKQKLDRIRSLVLRLADDGTDAISLSNLSDHPLCYIPALFPAPVVESIPLCEPPTNRESTFCTMVVPSTLGTRERHTAARLFL